MSRAWPCSTRPRPALSRCSFPRPSTSGHCARPPSPESFPLSWPRWPRPAPRRAATAGEGAAATLAAQLAALPAAQRRERLLDLIRGHVAAVLGHSASSEIDPAAAFKDLGFDSLTSVEFRYRLSAAAGLRLPATLIFDHPTPRVLAAFLDTQVTGAAPAAPARVTAADGEPIAIIGMACRYPGSITTPEQM